MLRLPEKFETPRLLLQRLKYEDAEEIFYAYASKSEATRYVTWATHQTIRDTRQYLATAVPAWNSGLHFNYSLRLLQDNRLVGSIGAINEGGRVQFGYIISPLWWNNGFATEACQWLLGQLILEKSVFRIWTFVDVDNESSCAVLRKCGMIEEARMIRWHSFVNQDNKAKDCIFFRYPIERP